MVHRHILAHLEYCELDIFETSCSYTKPTYKEILKKQGLTTLTRIS
jgi:hypothetical protein